LSYGTDPDIAAAMMGELDHDVAVARAELRYAVSRQMFDNESGALLDVRSAVLIHVRTPSGKSVMEVYDARRWDAQGADVSARCAGADIDLRVVDGRELFGGRPAAGRPAAEPDAEQLTFPQQGPEEGFDYDDVPPNAGSAS